MKERPILFSAPMVQAILAGTKTQTRRVAKAVKHPDFGNIYEPSCMAREEQHAIERACPYGEPGDRLWLRETWQGPLTPEDDPYPEGLYSPKFCEYKADGGPAPEFMTADDKLVCRWRPSIHMPRWASRITLEVTGVRVELLQACNEVDAIAEGAPWAACGSPQDGSHKAGFAQLWESINGPGSWEANPWVWVVEFQKVKA